MMESAGDHGVSVSGGAVVLFGQERFEKLTGTGGGSDRIPTVNLFVLGAAACAGHAAGDNQIGPPHDNGFAVRRSSERVSPGFCCRASHRQMETMRTGELCQSQRWPLWSRPDWFISSSRAVFSGWSLPRG